MNPFSDQAEPKAFSADLATHRIPPLATVDAATAVLEEDILAVPLRRLRTVRQLIRSRKFLIGLAMFGVIALLAIFAPLVARYDPYSMDFSHAGSILNQNPTSAHMLGTDYLGRDMWARLVWGGRTSLFAGCLIVLISLCTGVPWGIVAGYGGRVMDDLLMRLIDILLAFPGLVLALAIVAFMGSSIRSVIIALGIGGVPGYARIARASTLSTKGLDYVLVARSQGAGPAHIMRVHVLRNIIDPLVILATLNLSGAILAAAALSFLGVGTQPPSSDWGTMLSDGYAHMFQSWSQLVFPAIIIVWTVLGINLMGDALGEALNPRMQRR